MVTAKVISDQFHIPRSTLYRLVDEGKVPVHDVTADYHQRRQIRFKVSEVQTALDRIKAQRKPAP